VLASVHSLNIVWVVHLVQTFKIRISTSN